MHEKIEEVTKCRYQLIHCMVSFKPKNQEFNMAKLNVMHSLILSAFEPQTPNTLIQNTGLVLFLCTITFALLTVSKPLYGPKQKGWGNRRASQVHVESPQLCDNSSEWFRIFILIAPKRFAWWDVTTNTFHKPQVNYRLPQSLTQSLEITGDLWKHCVEGKSASLSSAQALLLKWVNCFPLGGLGGDHINDSKSAVGWKH